MNEVTYYREQEAAANGQNAHDLIVEAFDLWPGDFPTEAHLSKLVYKYTDCGANVTIDSKARIIFGSIVEGSDAEITCDPIPTEGRDRDEVIKDIRATLAWLEDEIGQLA